VHQLPAKLFLRVFLATNEYAAMKCKSNRGFNLIVAANVTMQGTQQNHGDHCG
jgi:hypothetical protein